MLVLSCLSVPAVEVYLTVKFAIIQDALNICSTCAPLLPNVEKHKDKQHVHIQLHCSCMK